jgi:NADH-quinone oxidoreductase subunit N
VNSAHLPTIAQNLAASAGDMSRPELMVLVLAGLMIMVGLAFKLSAVPFHFWCPDIFEGAAAEVGAFLSIASKAAALALLVRVAFGVGMIAPDRIAAADMAPVQEAVEQTEDEVASFPVVGGASNGMFAVADEVSSAEAKASKAGPLAPIRKFMGIMIAVIAAITCTFGNLAAYGQTNIKRLFAYSTIAHAGYMMMPIPAALAVATQYPDSARSCIAAILIYIVIYMFMNLGAFAVVAFLRNTMGTEEIDDFSGMISKAPVLVICFALIMFSLVGLPPLAGFVGKFALFAGLADGYFLTGETHLVALLAVGGVNTAISLFYYLRVVKVMTIDAESDAISKHEGPIIGWLPLAFVAAVTVPVAVLIVNWNQLAVWSRAATQQLFG